MEKYSPIVGSTRRSSGAARGTRARVDITRRIAYLRSLASIRSRAAVSRRGALWARGRGPRVGRGAGYDSDRKKRASFRPRNGNPAVVSQWGVDCWHVGLCARDIFVLRVGRIRPRLTVRAVPGSSREYRGREGFAILLRAALPRKKVHAEANARRSSAGWRVRMSTEAASPSRASGRACRRGIVASKRGRARVEKGTTGTRVVDIQRFRLLSDSPLKQRF